MSKTDHQLLVSLKPKKYRETPVTVAIALTMLLVVGYVAEMTLYLVIDRPPTVLTTTRLIVLLIALVAFDSAERPARAMRLRRRLRPLGFNACPNCLYDLHHTTLPGACPECGFEIPDINLPDTWRHRLGVKDVRQTTPKAP